MNERDLAQEVSQIRTLIGDLASKVQRQQTFYGVAPREAAAPEPSGGFVLIKPYLLAEGTEADYSTAPNWSTVSLRNRVPVGVRAVRLSFRIRVTEQTHDQLMELKIRANEGAGEVIANWTSAGTGDDIANVHHVDVAVTGNRCFDYSLLGYRLFGTGHQLGAATLPSGRIAWVMELVGYHR